MPKIEMEGREFATVIVGTTAFSFLAAAQEVVGGVPQYNWLDEALTELGTRLDAQLTGSEAGRQLDRALQELDD